MTWCLAPGKSIRNGLGMTAPYHSLRDMAIGSA